LRCVANFNDKTVELNNKNKVEKVGIFSDPKECPSKRYDPPATHHNFTTKIHAKKRTFSQNPLQKRPSTTQ
jgi:hypothetical protein